MYLGDFAYGATVFVDLNTYDSNGASITLTGLAVTDIEIYKGSSMTQRASDAGYTLLDTDGIDLDAITGIHGFSIDTADNTTAGFFAPGNDYKVVVSSVTIDTRTVNFVRTFSVENRKEAGLLARTTIAVVNSQLSFTLTAGSVDNDAYNNCILVFQDAASVVQKATNSVLDYTGATKTVSMLTAPVFTIAAGDHVAIYAGVSAPQTGDAYLRLNSGGDGLGALSSGLGAVQSQAALIEEKTASLTFTVAGKVDANITHVIGSAQQLAGVGNKNIGPAV